MRRNGCELSGVFMSGNSTMAMLDRRNGQLVLKNLILIILCPIRFRGSALASPLFFLCQVPVSLLDGRIAGADWFRHTLKNPTR